MAHRQDIESTTENSDSRYHHGDLRAALLTAAEQELAERGLEGFSLRGVAKRAGVSHAAPAHHFGDVTGLLTALAAAGFRCFVQMQTMRQARAEPDGMSQLVASGLGYVDFAMTNAALFRLMFSSKRPDFRAPELCDAAGLAFEKLNADVARAHPELGDGGDGAGDGGGGTLKLEAAGTWAIVHGLADLLNAGRLHHLLDMGVADRDAAIATLLRKSFS